MSNPKEMGMQIQDLVDRFNKSLPRSYESLMLERFKMDYPDRNPSVFPLAWIEMRRFFVLTAIYRYVPMFSNVVDDVWHTMLLFTKMYERLCNNYLGHMIHHNPNVGAASARPDWLANERLWFEWIYGSCFEVTPLTTYFFGPFGKHKRKSFFRSVQVDHVNDMPAKVFRSVDYSDTFWHCLKEGCATPYNNDMVGVDMDIYSLIYAKPAEQPRRRVRWPFVREGQGGLLSFLWEILPALASFGPSNQQSGSGHHSCHSSSCGGSSCGSGCGSGCGGGCGGD